MNPKKSNFKNVFALKMDPDELKNQVDNYATLSIWKSYRKQIVLTIGFFLVLSFLFILFSGDILGQKITMSDFVFELILYIPILFFVYKGHRWAMIVLIVFWIFEQGYKLMLGAGSPVIIFFYWYIIMIGLYKAIKIENEKTRINMIKIND